MTTLKESGFDYPIHQLRELVRFYNGQIESFNTRFSIPQLIKLHEMYIASGWLITPDHWTPRQVKEALEGLPPMFDEHERPTYDATRSVLPSARKSRGRR